MSEFTIGGDVNAGRDNVFNVTQERYTYKPLDQQTPSELRHENHHSLNVSWDHRKELIKKSSILIPVLLLGLAGIFATGIFAQDIFLSYNANGSKGIVLAINFINSFDPQVSLIAIAGFIIFTLLVVVLPTLLIMGAFFKDDEFLREEKEKRKYIKKRIKSLGEKL